MAARVRVLFLCAGNSCRSQMAEGWAIALKGESIEADSAGIETHGLNESAVRVMSEAGVDISDHRSKTLEALKGVELDYDQAHGWFHLAAEQGNLMAQRNLGLLHARSLARIPDSFFDPVEANFWFSLVAAGTPGASELAAASYPSFVDPDSPVTLKEDADELDALTRSVITQFEQYVKLNRKIPPEVLVSVNQIDEPGKLADLIVVDGNPLADIGVVSRVDIVMKGGAIWYSERAAFGSVVDIGHAF